MKMILLTAVFSIATIIAFSQSNPRIKMYTDSIAKYPNQAKYYVLRGSWYGKEGTEPDLAIKDFNKAIELDDRNAKAYYYRAKRLYDAKKYTEAEADFTRAIVLDPSDSYHYQSRAQNYEALGKLDDAEKNYLIAYRIDPDRSSLYVARASVLHKLKKYVLAIDVYTLGLKKNEKDYHIHLWRGMSYYEISQWNRVIEDMTEFIDSQGWGDDASSQDKNGLYWAYYYRGNVNGMTGRYDAAVEDFTELIKLQPSNADLYQWRGSAYYYLKNFKAAKTDLQMALKLKPDHASAKEMLSKTEKEMSGQ